MATKKTATKKTATKKTRPRPGSRKSSLVNPPPKPYSCDTPPDEPMSLEQTAELLKIDPEFALFMGTLLCRTNSGDTKASACLEAFYEPTDDELAGLCIPPGQYYKYKKCTEQSILLSPIAYAIVGKEGFNRRKR